MTNAHTRRQAALKAIEQVRGGTQAGSVETESIDFKEEAGSVGRDGARRPIDARDEGAARALAEEAACLANSDQGGVLIVGVDDRAAGEAAFVGAYLDTAWLRQRIYALTTPGLAVDEPEEVTVAGARVYLVNVAPALEEIRCQGKLRARLGTDCVELTGDRARQFLERRRNYDWSSAPSGLRLSDASREALSSARRHFRDEHGAEAQGDLAVVRRLGVAIDDGDDPVLSRAGALLLCVYDDDGGGLDLQVKVGEGAPSQARLELRAPLIVAFDRAWAELDRVLPASAEIVGAQRRQIRPLPMTAIRETLANAIAHRDYRLVRGATVILALGEPTRILKVTSPGTLPPGVSVDRLIATPSRPRNPALAGALRALGIGEGEGIGIDRMFGAMLREGHPPPEIDEAAGDVSVRLSGGRSDPVILDLYDRIFSRDPALQEDVRTPIAVSLLLAETPLRPERVAGVAQCSTAEALEALEALERAGVITRLTNRARSFSLAPDVRTELGARVAYQPRRAIEEHWQLVRAYLDSRPVIGREDAAELLQVSAVRASQVLSELSRRGDIEPVDRARGRGVRYRRAASDGSAARQAAAPK
ncbi:ATP-binding protein [Miltoncostaea marina]|uniref:ATP-binding protein n=1 Tax=Miltoncostaea marina TaxID=2843215 RepID=UPI001C3D3725|nr:ATP-binding protein [Miltoncostaea marina]